MIKGGKHTLFLAVFLVNTAGLVAYLAWLVFGHPRIFYTQDGIVYLLPCLAFFFVYFFLFRGGQKEPEPFTDIDGKD